MYLNTMHCGDKSQAPKNEWCAKWKFQYKEWNIKWNLLNPIVRQIILIFYCNFVVAFIWSLLTFILCNFHGFLGVRLGKQLTLIMLYMIIIGRGENMGCGWRWCFKLSTPKEKNSNEFATYPKRPFKTHTSLRDKCNT